MTRVDGVRRAVQWWMLAGAAAGLISGCQDRASTNTSAKLIAGPDARSLLMAEATGNYAYGAERQHAVAPDSLLPGPGGSLPTITISTATRDSVTGRDTTSRFSARITSSAAYPSLGLAPGANYIWRDTASVANGGPYRLLVIPADTTYPMMWLKRDTTVVTYVSGAATEPRLARSNLAFGMCENGCGSGHCATRGTGDAFSTGAKTIHIMLP